MPFVFLTLLKYSYTEERLSSTDDRKQTIIGPRVYIWPITVHIAELLTRPTRHLQTMRLLGFYALHFPFVFFPPNGLFILMKARQYMQKHRFGYLGYLAFHKVLFQTSGKKVFIYYTLSICICRFQLQYVSLKGCFLKMSFFLMQKSLL